MDNVFAGFDADITKELEIVRALIAKNGNPALSEETLRKAEAAQAASDKMVVRAQHINGYVKGAFGCERSGVADMVGKLEAAGHWVNISVAEFVPMRRKPVAR